MAINVSNSANAASAYAQAASRVVEGATGKSDGVSGAAGSAPSFSDMIKDSISDAIDTTKASEKISIGAVTGKADVVDLVTAVNDAEMTLQTVVAVRDRVVQAYQEIMRMPI